jgi:1,6-anhydro-N-acetylmuramate kinase
MWRGIFNRRDPLDPVERIDRQRFYENHRLVCGLHLHPTFKHIDGAVVLVRGCGKWMKLQTVEFVQIELPAPLQRAATEILTAQGENFAELVDLNRDLSEYYSQLIWKLKTAAGKASEQLLVAAVTDPGIWSQENGSRTLLANFCAPDALAEQSSLTIVDAFPARDLAVGGHGCPLSPLPMWFIFADRNERVSRCNRLLIRFSYDIVELISIPASDGLDIDLPNLYFRTFAIEANPSSNSDADAENVVHQLKTFVDFIESCSTNSDSKIHEFVLTGNFGEPHKDALQKEFSETPILSSDHFQIDPPSMDATLAAILGLMHVDQLPANIPALTGCQSPRILGRITPGRPANWRKVLLNMADYRPPAMKLRDAV